MLSFLALDGGLQSYLDQINQIEEQVTALEQAAYKLDTYSKKLGEYKHLELCGKNTALCFIKWFYIDAFNFIKNYEGHY